MGDDSRVTPIAYRPSAILDDSPVEDIAMTDIREKTFRLTQFARCAG